MIIITTRQAGQTCDSFVILLTIVSDTRETVQAIDEVALAHETSLPDLFACVTENETKRTNKLTNSTCRK